MNSNSKTGAQDPRNCIILQVALVFHTYLNKDIFVFSDSAQDGRRNIDAN